MTTTAQLCLSTETAVDADTTARRTRLADQLQQLPAEAFTRLQYLQVQVGCFNRCAFCSQSAGADIWQVSANGLADLAAALSTVTRRRNLRLGADRTVHRPGVLFPYLDNDITSYTHLAQLVEHCARELDAKLRFSTVGYSRHNAHLVATHRRIVTDHPGVVDGIRFSLTPYAVGFRTNRAEYIDDVAAALRTWKPYIDRVGPGAATAAVELRFPPLARAFDAPLFDEIVAGRHIIATGPHLLVSVGEVIARPEPTRIAGVHGREARFTRDGEPYLHLISDELLAAGEPAELALAALDGLLIGPHRVRHARLHTWRNADGPYYAIDPAFTLDGRYRALQIYPQTAVRRRSGYTDATRFFLNALLAHKTASGIGRRAAFPHATWGDAGAVIDRLRARARQISDVDTHAARHVERQVLPLVSAHLEILRAAGFPASAFFDRNFTIDTGQIVNQGKAITQFRGLAATEDEPMTPREERGYGQISLSSIRGTVWRIAPAPLEHHDVFFTGGKNQARDKPTLIVEELDPQHLRPVDRATGQPLRRYVIDGVDTEKLSLADADTLRAYPGATP